ncbi:MAG: indolepyruvate oxidoreductase subunit beta [Clostridiales bacterium]|jgi:indolepyruvate ferredoxin oxidoreductase beta subunit|nr:indolepyruvate oxidoreductase subunit beta [Clostridiales bacterium]
MISILIAGVGGQGTLLASKILGVAALNKGMDVKVSEVHGMSQRGGSVVTYVRFGKEKIWSPIIDEGGADVLLAFEELEAARSLTCLKPGGTVVVSTQRINPATVTIGVAVYPENCVQMLRDAGANVIAADAMALAKKAGNVRAVNIALIGTLAAACETGLTREDFERALTELIPAQYLEVNLKAFELGYNYKDQ